MQHTKVRTQKKVFRDFVSERMLNDGDDLGYQISEYAKPDLFRFFGISQAHMSRQR